MSIVYNGEIGKNRDIIQVGSVYGMLTVVSEGERLRLPSGQTNRTMICKCECGNVKQIRLVHLTNNKIISCGCFHRKMPIDSDKNIYKRWLAINYRCHVSKNIDTYQENGITVCDEWRNSFSAFEKWANENGFKKDLQIDRIDNSKGYYPDNCRFVTNTVNVNNRDITFNVLYNGIVRPYMDIVREKNLFSIMHTIRRRIKRGWKAQRAIDTPVKDGNYTRKHRTKDEAKKAYELHCSTDYRNRKTKQIIHL